MIEVEARMATNVPIPEGRGGDSATAGRATYLNPRMDQSVMPTLTGEWITRPLKCGDTFNRVPDEACHLQKLSA